MFITRIEAENFASYKHLEFNFDNKGLSLLHGATGSGKSTFCDVIPWVLFGRTAKNGAADDVLSWGVNAPTKATVFLSLPGGDYSVTRIRSKGNKANDLYYQSVPSYEAIRGKDSTDTQKRINALLGMDCELYLSGAYYHEFSQTAGFFTATAKNRRLICEQIVDLSTAKKLQSLAGEQRKASKEMLVELEAEEYVNKGMRQRLVQQEKENTADFKATQAAEIELLQAELKLYEPLAVQIPILKEKLVAMNSKDICTHCGNAKSNKDYDSAVVQLHKAQTADQLKKRCEASIKAVLARKVPTSVLKEIEEIDNILVELKDAINEQRTAIEDYGLLEDVALTHRGATIKSTISLIETTTNEYLSKYYDAEISVSLNTEDADKIDIDVFKDGNRCAVSQLSKGQRTLLKFCFGVSVMKVVALHHGIAFKQVFFDEALDGLDEQLKLKTLNMLWTLVQEYDTIMIVEHSSELRAQIDQKYEVRLTGGSSNLA